MTTVAQLITKQRRFVRDFSKLTRETWDGDGSTLAFRTNDNPILEASYTVKIGAVVQTETTDYTIDLDNGLVTFKAASVPASGDDNVSIDFKYAALRDEDWLEIFNNVIRDIRDSLYSEEIDTTNITTVAKQNEYSLATISTNIVDVLSIAMRTSSSNPWVDLRTLGMGWKYLAEANEIQINPTFDVAGNAMKIHYLYGFDEVTATTEDVDVPTKWFNVLKLYMAAEYYDRIVPDKLTETAVVTKERTYHPADTVIRAAEYYRNKGDEALKKVRPPKRAKPIPNRAK